MNPFASLIVTYLVGAAMAAILFFITAENKNPIGELAKINWAPLALGVVIVGLEAGYIYAYKAGWPVSTAATVQSAFLAVALLFVGFFLYKEGFTRNKVIGIAICLVGLFFINR